MHSTLLLTSAGLSNSEIKNNFLSLLTKKPKETTVAHVTTAAWGETPNPHWLDITKNELRNCGIIHIKDIDIKDKSKSELETFFADKDVILINGGNTFYLLKYIRETGFDKIISKKIDQGALYMGISAGSYIMCPTIEQAAWKQLYPDRNHVKLTDLTGLNYVPFFIVAHYEKKLKTAIETDAKEANHPTIVLSDNQAVVYKDGEYKIIGEGERIVFGKIDALY